MFPRHRAPRRLLLTAGSLLAVACIVSTNTETEPIDRDAIVGTRVKSPIKAHLRDGGVIVFADGALVTDGTVSGAGNRLDVTRQGGVPSIGISLDSVIGFEVYRRRVNPLRTVVYSSAATAVGVVTAAGLAFAIFGSCPTVYGDSAGIPVLQAESFSYSIAPLLAKRDVDRMSISANAEGVIRLAVRNEALETHHIDHMEVMEVRHRANEMALPSPRGSAIAVSGLVAGAVVTDAAGRNVSRVVARPDESAFSTDDGLLDRAIAGGSTDDALTITIPRRAGTDSIALVLKARSSLLTTSVLYEHLMGRQGALALDWMGEGLSRITTLAGLASWYGGNFGMRVEVQDGARWRSVIRLMDFGPTAWRTVGVALPAVHSDDDSVRVRLVFAADAYRVDHLALAHGMRRLEQRRLPVARAFDRDGTRRTDVVAMLLQADDREVETNPGDQFWIEFDAGPESLDSRTFLFAGQGYYVEWLRPSWMRDARSREPFSPSRTSMRDLLRSWKGGRDSLESVFFTRTVPVT